MAIGYHNIYCNQNKNDKLLLQKKNKLWLSKMVISKHVIGPTKHLARRTKHVMAVTILVMDTTKHIMLRTEPLGHTNIK